MPPEIVNIALMGRHTPRIADEGGCLDMTVVGLHLLVIHSSLLGHDRFANM